MTADVHEWNQLAIDVGKAPLRIVKQAGVILVKTLADGTRDAKAFCPVDTGNLMNSIGWEIHGLEGEFGPTADYGEYVEDGTSVMAPHAYVGPAFDRQQPVFATAVASLTEAIL